MKIHGSAKSAILILALCSVSWAGVYGGGSGTEADPFMINTAEQLNSIGTDVNDWDKHFVLGADIDLAGYTGNSFNIIGTSYTVPFEGTFDGAGHTISNFTYNDPNQDYVGLFRSTEATTIIKNLTLENLNVSGDGSVGGLVAYNQGAILNVDCSGVVSGYSEVGGIVGESYDGYIRDCNSSVNVNIGDWGGGGICGYQCDTPNINCRASGNIDGGGTVGGLVGGSRWSYLINCYATGDVNGEYDVGGLVGWHDWYHIQCCYATGRVQANENGGGLVGESTGTIENSYSSGDVNSPITAGGFLGVDWGGWGTFKCFSSGRVTGSQETGAFVGERTLYAEPNTYQGCFYDITINPTLPAFGNVNDTNVIGKTTEELYDVNTFTEAGWDFAGESGNGAEDYWSMPSGGGYPVLSFEIGQLPDLPAFSGGFGTSEEPYLISNTSEFNLIGNNYRLQDKHFRLINDLDFNDVELAPIGKYDLPFIGSWDGNKHRMMNINNLRHNDEDYCLGVIGYLGTGGKICDLGVENIDINDSAVDYIGGICGYVYGAQISRCYATGKIKAIRGGFIAGETAQSRMENCYGTGCLWTGYKGGGLVGWDWGGYIKNSYSTAKVNGWQYAGNLSGSNRGEFWKCFYDKTINPIMQGKGMVADANIFGCRPAELQDADTFINKGWDFEGESTNGTEDIWSMPPNGAPVFAWQNDVTVPDVNGLNVGQVGNVIAQAGLVCIDSNAYSETVSVGYVMKQVPPAGLLYASGTPVYVLVSAGPCPYSGGGSGTKENPCKIANAADFNLLAGRAGDCSLAFELVNDVNLAGVTYNGYAIPPFTGWFDGRGHVISNYKIQISGYEGLFKQVGCGGGIKNLNVTNVTFLGSNYQAASGAIVATLSAGLIENCKVYGTVLPGGARLGGILARNSSGIVRHCFVSATITGSRDLAGIAVENSSGTIYECGANVTLTSSNAVAGLVGNNSGLIKNCYARGSLAGSYYGGGLASQNSGQVENSYAACSITGTYYNYCVGALIGYEGSSPMTYPGCVWDKTVCNRQGTGRNSPSVVGKTTAEMKMKSTFTDLGWDFTNENANGNAEIWRMCTDGTNYPKLNAEMAAGDFECPDGVEWEDMAYFASCWLQESTEHTSADITGDGTVSFEDFACMAGNWMR